MKPNFALILLLLVGSSLPNLGQESRREVHYYPLIRSISSPVSKSDVLRSSNITSLLNEGVIDRWKRDTTEQGVQIEKFRHDFRLVVKRGSVDELQVHFPNVIVVDGVPYRVSKRLYFSLVRDIWGALPEDLRINRLPDIVFDD